MLASADDAKPTGVFRRAEIRCTPATGGIFTTCCGFRLPEQPVKLPAASVKTAVTVLLPWTRAEPRTVRVAWPLLSRAMGLPRLFVPLATNCTVPLGTAVLGALATAATAKVTLLVGGTVHLSEATPAVALAGVTVKWPLARLKL